MQRKQTIVPYFVKGFHVTDEIQFASGKLLQAVSPEGDQVVLQMIKRTDLPLPPDYQAKLLQFEHQNMVSIYEVIEEENRIMLVHPTFSGEPLPLVVRKNAISPRQAWYLAHKLLHTLEDLQRLDLPLTASLDPKNILLINNEPTVMFYTMLGLSVREDQKWRELFFYLLTGTNPVRSKEENQKLLAKQKVPRSFQRLALKFFEKERELSELIREVDLLGKDLKSQPAQVKTQKKSRRPMLLLIGLLVCGLMMGFWWITDTRSATSSVVASTASQDSGITTMPNTPSSVSFSDTSNTYTIPHPMANITFFKGQFIYRSNKPFKVILETSDSQSQYGLEVLPSGEMKMFEKIGNNSFVLGGSGSHYQIQRGKSYEFEMVYIPGDPIRMQVQQVGSSERFIAVGSTPNATNLMLKFSGGTGDKILEPVVQMMDRNLITQTWQQGLTWNISFGMGIQNYSSLYVYPQTIVQIPVQGVTEFNYSLEKHSSDPLVLNLNDLDGSTYQLSIGANIALQRFHDQLILLKKEHLPWTIQPQQNVQISLMTELNQLDLSLGQGTNTKDFAYQQINPFALKSVTVSNNTGFYLEPFILPPTNNGNG